MAVLAGYAAGILGVGNIRHRRFTAAAANKDQRERSWKYRAQVDYEASAVTTTRWGAGQPSMVFEGSLGSRASCSDSKVIHSVVRCSSVVVNEVSITSMFVYLVSRSHVTSCGTVGSDQTLRMRA